MVLELLKQAVVDLRQTATLPALSMRVALPLKGCGPVSSRSEQFWGWFAPTSSGEPCRHVFQRDRGRRLPPKDRAGCCPGAVAAQHPTVYSIFSDVSFRSDQEQKLFLAIQLHGT